MGRKGQIAWNKGLTKDTSPSLREMGNREIGVNNPNNILYGKASRELLAQLYLTEKLTLKQIAQKFGVDKNTVRNHLIAYGIPIRSKAEANRLKDYSTMEGRGEKISARLKGTTSMNRSNAKRKQWHDPVFMAKMMEAFAVKPTKPEKALDNILSNHFPEYQYNGDGRLGVTLAGMVPDWINVNGNKEVIELFSYWHVRSDTTWSRTELGRIMAYNSLGFKCLIIWDNELKDTDKLINKIREFTQPRRR